MNVRRATDDDRAWMAEAIIGAFASTRVVSRGQVHDDAHHLDGFVVELDGRPVGCALWHEIEGDAELVVLVTTYRGVGAGTVLLDAVVDHARNVGWKRLWLVTTNDNTDAIRLYQRAGWAWVGFHQHAVTESRELKPELPEVGNHSIPIAHEIEFEYPL
ncbi:MAG TPA: GNAT family N-acetyltransferase [Acidimicrobiia bacterium]|jgi:N-acetylglutamate synthase-like GNAT family acetyltransferase|nr:GNAT family N-acetyltransferase [Acidimicrobiia bacterium]